MFSAILHSVIFRWNHRKRTIAIPKGISQGVWAATCCRDRLRGPNHTHCSILLSDAPGDTVLSTPDEEIATCELDYDHNYRGPALHLCVCCISLGFDIY